MEFAFALMVSAWAVADQYSAAASTVVLSVTTASTSVSSTTMMCLRIIAPHIKVFGAAPSDLSGMEWVRKRTDSTWTQFNSRALTQTGRRSFRCERLRSHFYISRDFCALQQPVQACQHCHSQHLLELWQKITALLRHRYNCAHPDRKTKVSTAKAKYFYSASIDTVCA